MKNTKVLSLLLLLASTQMYSFAAVANPDLLFVQACQTLKKLEIDIQWDSDGVGAIQLLDIANKCIDYDVNQQKSLDASKNTFLYKGVPLDLAKIEAENKNLQNDLKNIKNSIHRLDDAYTANKGKIKDRKRDRTRKEKQLDENKAAIAANAAAMTTAQTAEATIKVLREKNALAFEDAIESYIALYGQCYSSGSMWGSSTVISSKYDDNIAITPNEYNQLVATLQNAVAPFNNVTLELSSDQDMHVNVSQILGFLANMKPAANRSWAQFGMNVGIGAAIAAGAIVAIGAASNAYQGKDLLDTGDASALLNSGVSNVSNAYDAAINSSAGQQLTDLISQANSAGQVAYQNILNSSAGQATQATLENAQAAGQSTFDAIINSQAAQAVQNNYLNALSALGYQNLDRQDLIENFGASDK
ncbi:MAG: hypothetical protein Q8Q60_05310 [Candidatus Chromulinivorax sp.]|nr:hypothetical protein [Candidatus Chromulinivorax sp.]